MLVCEQVTDFDFAPFAETAVLLYGAAFVAERYAGAYSRRCQQVALRDGRALPLCVTPR